MAGNGMIEQTALFYPALMNFSAEKKTFEGKRILNSRFVRFQRSFYMQGASSDALFKGRTKLWLFLDHLVFSLRRYKIDNPARY